MIHFEVTDNKTLIEFKVKPANLFFRIVLFIVALFPLPIVFALLFTDNEISPFGIFVALLFLGGLSFFLFRLLLWNIYGKETYTITNHEFSAFNDFGWFRDNKRAVSGFSKIELLFTSAENSSTLFKLTEIILLEENKEFVIAFLVDGVPYISVVKQNKKDIEDFAKAMGNSFPLVTTLT